MDNTVKTKGLGYEDAMRGRNANPYRYIEEGRSSQKEIDLYLEGFKEGQNDRYIYDAQQSLDEHLHGSGGHKNPTEKQIYGSDSHVWDDYD